MQSKSRLTLSTFNEVYPRLIFVDRIHGSGTPVGDALELQGLKLALTELGYEQKICVVGSNKGNIGNAQVSYSIVIEEPNDGMGTDICTACIRTCVSRKDMQINTARRNTAHSISSNTQPSY